MRYWDRTEDITENRFIEATGDVAQEMTVTLISICALVALAAGIQLKDVSRRGRETSEQGTRNSSEIRRPGVFIMGTIVLGVLSGLFAATRTALNPFSPSGSSFSAKDPTVALSVVCCLVALGLVIRLGKLQSGLGDPLGDRRPWPFRVTVALVAALAVVWLAATTS